MKQSIKIYLLCSIIGCFFILQSCECRYLPTRNYNDNLEKLRELMYQILESSGENGVQDAHNPSTLLQWNKQNLADSDISQSLQDSRDRYGHRYDSSKIKFLLRHPHLIDSIDDII